MCLPYVQVGGSSPFEQRVILNGALSVGEGGGSIHSNGTRSLDESNTTAIFEINSSPELPLSLLGNVTVEGTGFIFRSGNIEGGSFQFAPGSVLNFTGSPLKTISSTEITSQGVILLQSEDANGSTLFLINSARIDSKYFEALSSLSVRVDPDSSLTIDTLRFNGKKFFLQVHDYRGSIDYFTGQCNSEQLEFSGGYNHCI